MKLWSSFLSACLLAIAAAPIWAADMTILVDRREKAIAIYFEVPATTLPSVFGAGAESLLEADGTVDVPKLYDGTFLLADEIFARSTVTLNGRETSFEGLSMMVHDPDILPDFASPYDAELSVAVCTSPETVEHMTLETLEAYLGYYAWDVDETSAIRLEFPVTGRDDVEIRVFEFLDLKAVDERTVTLEDGGAISFQGVQPSNSSIARWLFGLSAAFLALAVVLLRPRASHARRDHA